MTVPARKSISRVNAALRWRVGRSGERGTLAFAHAFGFRSNKGGEEPPTTSHTTLPHIHAHSLGRSLLTRQVERPVLSRALSLSPPLSLPFSLFSWKQMTERHGHRGSPDVPRPAGLHGITTPTILSREESLNEPRLSLRSHEFAFVYSAITSRELKNRATSRPREPRARPVARQ